MQAVQGVGVEKGVKEPGAPDVTDQGDVMASEPQILKSLIQGLDHKIMGASRAKHRRPVGVEQTRHAPPP
jgi:hypothetical protein